MAFISKIKSLFYSEGANIDANYGPWNSIFEYESWLVSIGAGSIPDGVTIAVRDSSGEITKYVRQNNSWKKDGGMYWNE